MYSPGLDLHEWESEWEALEEDLRTDPARTVPELDRLLARMLEETGYDLSDPVGEREVVAEYLAAHEIVEAVERDLGDLSPGDIAAAVNGFRAVFDHLVATRAAVDVQLDDAEEA